MIGVGEANALIKGEATLSAVLTASLKSYAQLPKALAKLAARGAEKTFYRTGAYIALTTGNKGAYLGYRLAGAEIELATLRADQILAEIQWARGTGAVVENIGKHRYVNQAGKVVEEALEVFKDTKGKFWIKEVGVIDEIGNLLDKTLIKELKTNGTNFTESSLKLITKDLEGKILFLENGSSSAGLKHIIERHWNEKELIRYFNSQDEMIQKIYSTINKEKFLTKEIVVRNGREGLEYTYKMSVKGIDKTFKFGVGSNGYIVTFYPQ